MLPNDLLGHGVDHWSTIDEEGGVEGAIIQALPDHLSDGGLGEGPVVDLLQLLSGWLLSHGQHCFHLHLNEAVV